MPIEQTLDQWIAEEKKRVVVFGEWYRMQRNAGRPAVWPLRMSPGEWDEQYRGWEETN